MIKSLVCAWLASCTITGPVTDVIDGDTIVVNKTHVRLWGINAPELDEIPAGPKSAFNLAYLLVVGDVTCEVKGKSHERVVAKCRTMSGADIAQRQVEQGHALDCEKFSHGAYRKYEQEAAKRALMRRPYC